MNENFFSNPVFILYFSNYIKILAYEKNIFTDPVFISVRDLI